MFAEEFNLAYQGFFTDGKLSVVFKQLKLEFTFTPILIK